MRRSNFALISALYSNKDAGLYKDIYFPIIKYAIVSLFYSSQQKEYYDLSDIQDFITREFGIRIPKLVLKKSVQKLDRSSDIDLRLYENGEKFRIRQAWDVQVNVEIDERREKFDISLTHLEEEYLAYKKREGLDDERLFIDFITDNSDDILGYFEKNDISRVDQKYTTMVYFLEYLHNNNNELFKVANELFWGSIITGFLKRDNPELESLKGIDQQEYYLDTSLIMAILQLSTPENESYAYEMLDIIIASGCIARVHPFTIREVTNIIQSVEANGPRLNSEIAEAYERYHLNPAKLAGIRGKLSTLLDQKGISLFPSTSEREINSELNKYKEKAEVKKLCENRGGMMYTDDLFRDAHDIYMDDYIRNRRKMGKSVFFVTLNIDLIHFCKERALDSECGMIHPGNIVLEMWMHNSVNEGLQDKALTATMARCLVMNNRDIRHKLGIVARHYNDTQENFDPDAYRAIIISLYKRDKEVITKIEEVEEREVDGNKEVYHAEMAKIAKNALEKVKEDANRISSMQEQITEMKQCNADMVVKMINLEHAKEQVDNLLNNESSTNKSNQKIIELYQEKDRLTTELLSNESTLNDLIQERDLSISYKRYYFRIWCPYIILAILLGIIIFIYLQKGTSLLLNIISVLVSICIFAITGIKANAFRYKAVRLEVKKEECQVWEEAHNEMQLIKDKIDNLKQHIKEIEKEIKDKR